MARGLRVARQDEQFQSFGRVAPCDAAGVLAPDSVARSVAWQRTDRPIELSHAPHRGRRSVLRAGAGIALASAGGARLAARTALGRPFGARFRRAAHAVDDVLPAMAQGAGEASGPVAQPFACAQRARRGDVADRWRLRSPDVLLPSEPALATRCGALRDDRARQRAVQPLQRPDAAKARPLQAARHARRAGALPRLRRMPISAG